MAWQPVHLYWEDCHPEKKENKTLLIAPCTKHRQKSISLSVRCFFVIENIIADFLKPSFQEDSQFHFLLLKEERKTKGIPQTQQ